MSDIVPISISATLDESTIEGMTRYSFTLYARDGETSRQFIVDVPNEPSGTCDVWVADCEVMVGDTPADGFATFTPNEAPARIVT